MRFRLTAVGRIALHAAQAADNDYNMGYVRFGLGQYTPDGNETDIRTPFNPDKRFPVLGVVVSPTEINIEITDMNVSDSLTTILYEYNVGEIGVYDANDVLVFIASRQAAEGWLLSKSAMNFLTLNRTLTFVDETTTNITFTGVPTFPPGNERIEGRLRLTTDAEAANRFEGRAALKASQAESAIRGATKQREGKTRYATDAEALAGANVDAALRPDQQLKHIVNFIPSDGVGGTANVIHLDAHPDASAYNAGDSYLFFAEADSNDDVSINLNALGQKDLYIGGSRAGSGDILDGELYLISYDGTKFIVLVSTTILSSLDTSALLRTDLSNADPSTSQASSFRDTISAVGRQLREVSGLTTTDRINLLAKLQFMDWKLTYLSSSLTNSEKSNIRAKTGSAKDPGVQVLNDASLIAWNIANGAKASVELTTNRTLGGFTNGAEDEFYTLRVKQPAAGGATLTLGTSYDRGDLPVPVFSTNGGETDLLLFSFFGGKRRYLGIIKGYAA